MNGLPVLRDLTCLVEKMFILLTNIRVSKSVRPSMNGKRPKTGQPDGGQKPQGSTLRAHQHTMSSELLGICSRLTKLCREGVAASCTGQGLGRLPRVSEKITQNWENDFSGFLGSWWQWSLLDSWV